MSPRAHLVLGILTVLVLPAASWLDGSGQLAWTMFSRTGSYRLRIEGWDDAGRARAVAPTALGRSSSRRAASFFAGADHFRMHDVARVTLRRHLDEVAALACRVTGLRRVAVTLDEQEGLDAPIRSRTVRTSCAH